MVEAGLKRRYLTLPQMRDWRAACHQAAGSRSCGGNPWRYGGFAHIPSGRGVHFPCASCGCLADCRPSRAASRPHSADRSEKSVASVSSLLGGQSSHALAVPRHAAQPPPTHRRLSSSVTEMSDQRFLTLRATSANFPQEWIGERSSANGSEIANDFIAGARGNRSKEAQIDALRQEADAPVAKEQMHASRVPTAEVVDV